MARRVTDSEEESVSRIVKARVKALDKRDPVRLALGALIRDSEPLPIIMDHTRPFGIVTPKQFMRRSVNPEARIEKAVHSTGVIHEDDTMAVAARALADRDAPFMPVAREGGKLAGAVRAKDVIHHLTHLDGHAASYTREVPFLSRTETLGDAIHHFAGTNAPILPVIDANGRVESVLRARDLLGAIFNPQRRPAGHVDFAMAEDHSRLELPVAHFMTASYRELKPDAGVDACLQALRDFTAVVVAAGTDVRGVLTPLDLVKGAGGEVPMTESELRIVPKRQPPR